ncbi:MAG: Abi family protein [Anaerovibrio sp.]|nr:Abi family protein [Anaerovibrio sp.]
MPREKFNIDGQIQQMKSKGITFNLIDEKKAKEFLTNHTYYFRLKFYASNYSKYTTGERLGQYVNLDFAYLKELSLLDVYIRRVLFSIVIDVEHYTKIRLLGSLEKNKREDGYKIVGDLFKKHPWLAREIERQKAPYTAGLIDKYHDHFAVWNVIEVLTFSNLILLYEFYYSRYNQKHVEPQYFYSVRNLRNSIAHNNCLMHDLRAVENGQQEKDEYICQLVADIPGIGVSMRSTKLSVPFLYDFVTTLEVFDKIVTSQKEKIKQLELLYIVVNNRFSRHIDYFETNPVVKTALDFMMKVVAYYRSKNLAGTETDDI